MYCQKCGTQNEDNANFCSNCATPLQQKEHSAPPIQQQPPKVKGHKKTGCLVVVIIFIIMIPLGILFASQNTESNLQSGNSVTKSSSSVPEAQETDWKAFDDRTWGDYKTLYLGHTYFADAIDKYSNNQANALDFYDYIKKAKDNFAKASLSFDYGVSEDEKTYLSSFKTAALADQQASENLLKYLDSNKLEDLSKAKENLKRASDALILIAENRVLLLGKAGYSKDEIKAIIEGIPDELEKVISEN